MFEDPKDLRIPFEATLIMLVSEPPATVDPATFLPTLSSVENRLRSSLSARTSRLGVGSTPCSETILLFSFPASWVNTSTMSSVQVFVAVVVKRSVRCRPFPGICRSIECSVDLRLVTGDSRGVLHDLVFNVLKTNFDGDVNVGGGTGHGPDFFKVNV